MTLLLGILIGVCFSPPPPEAVRGALDQVLAERRYQTDLPGPDGQIEPPGDRTSGSRDPGRTARRRRGRTYEPREGRDDGGGGFDFRGAGWAEALAVALLCGAGVLAVIGIARAVGGRRRAYVAPPRETPAAAPVLSEVPLGEIEALASAGRYDEAVHVLLLRSIAAVARTVSALPPSLTSREVLARAPLPDGARAELEGIVDAVETSWFGGRPVGREGFEACRERFRRFAALCGGPAA